MTPSASVPARIVLTGFMGCGKSTVGRLLAAQLGWRFFDLDTEIEQGEGRTVARIFAEDGEARFRELEATRLEALLQERQAVVALGGGAPGSPAVRALLSKGPHTLVVHLDAPFSVLYARCHAQSLDPAAAVRPLLGTSAQASARFDLRQPLYRAVAHATVAADLPTPGMVCSGILQLLGFPGAVE